MPASAYATSSAVATPALPTPAVTVPVIDEIRLPEEISRGIVGGPLFSTIVIETSSGTEQRVAQWTRGRSRWDISMQDRSIAQARVLYAFWLARKGKARGFRFKDWFDYTATDEELVPQGYPTVQLQKTYSDGLLDYVKPIVKPVSPTVTLKRNGSSFTAFTVDYTTGIVTFTADNSKSITNITKASSAVVTVGSSHGFSIGDYVYFSGVGGMTQINGLVGVVTSTAATTITVGINSTGFTTYTSGGTAFAYVKGTDTLTWSGEFDLPVRFDTDEMKLVQTDVTVREWESVPIVELIT